VENIAGKVEDAAGSVLLVGDPERYGAMHIKCVPDRRPGFGPLSGIETALLSGRGDLNLIVACDLPFLETDWLKLLLQTGENLRSICVVARDGNGRVHPLCGVYGSDCLPVVQQAIDAGRLKLMEIIQELGATYIDLPAAIWNVNTPEEWQRCREVANGR
jgi:molybdopterin-guanine dinucleotide biosynthesis protein A